MRLAVVDTHRLVWWAREDHRRLGRRARRVFEQLEAGRAALYVPTIVLDELGELARRGMIALAGWTCALLANGGFFPAELTVDVVLDADALRVVRERTTG